MLRSLFLCLFATAQIDDFKKALIVFGDGRAEVLTNNTSLGQHTPQ